MNKNMFMAIIVAMFFLVISSAQAQLYPKVIVSDYSIKEGSANVGEDFTLVLTLTNIEPICATLVMTNVQSSPPFINKGISTVLAGDICQGASKKVEVPMRIDPTATGGTYTMTIQNSYETELHSQYSSSSTINIFVNGTPDINVHIINSNPLEVYPGDTATITMNLENDGTFQAQALSASLTVSKPLVVKWSKDFSSMGKLDPRQSKTADFTIEVPKDAKAQSYPISLQVSYLDENRIMQVRNFNLMFNVENKAAFEAADAGSDKLFANKNARVVRLNLKNTGTDAARRVKIILQPQFPFSTDGSVRYAEIIDQGSQTAVSFVVDVDKDATVGTYSLDLLLNFEDAQGKQLQDTAKVSLTVEKEGFVNAVFVDYWALWVVGLLLVLLIVRRRLKKGKKGK